MVAFGVVRAIYTGDIGGPGISRFAFQRQDAAVPTVTDCNTATAAVRDLYAGLAAHLPSNLTVTVQPDVEMRDVATALVQGTVSASSIPAAVGGLDSGSYAAGVGGRINWLTSSLHGRRLIQGSTRIVPLGPSQYTTTGGLNTSIVSLLLSQAATYMAATGGGAIEYIVWHRPPKGTFSGGAAGLITAAKVSSTPTGLRSRRS